MVPPATDRFTAPHPTTARKAIPPAEAAVTTEPISGAPLHPEEVAQPISVPPPPTGTGVTALPHGVHSRTVHPHTAHPRGAAPPQEALPTRHPAAAPAPAPAPQAAAPLRAPDHRVAVPAVVADSFEHT